MSEHDDDPIAVPVIIEADNTSEKTEAATFGGWSTYVLTPGLPPQQILRFNERRRRATLFYSNSVDETMAHLFVGSRNQINIGGPTPGGGVLATQPGSVVSSFVVESASEIWGTSIDNGITVTVLDEVYRDD